MVGKKRKARVWKMGNGYERSGVADQLVKVTQTSRIWDVDGEGKKVQ